MLGHHQYRIDAERDRAGDAIALHARSGVDRVAPQVEEILVMPEHAGDDGAAVNADADLPARGKSESRSGRSPTAIGPNS